MIAAPPKLPQSLDEFDEDVVLRIPCTYDEYLALVEETAYPIQFFDDEILIMGQATDTHEQFVARLIRLLGNYFEELDDSPYRLLGSNVKIVIPERKGDFNPDVTMMREASDYGPTPTGRSSTVRIKNPYLVAEVLSNATRDFDLGAKMRAYERVASLQHVLTVDQHAVHVAICSRTNQPGQWLLTNYYALTDVVAIDGFNLPLTDIYRKIVLK